MEFILSNWNLSLAGSSERCGRRSYDIEGLIPTQQYDNLTVELVINGDFDSQFDSWSLIINKGRSLDIVTLENVAGKSKKAVLSASQLAFIGSYSIQIKAVNTNVTVGDTHPTKHSSICQFNVNRTLSGDAQWPIIPTEFTEFENRILGYISEVTERAEEAGEKAFEAAQSASEAAGSAKIATNAADIAIENAEISSENATEARESANSAAQKASEAAESASNAAESAENAVSYATAAQGYSENASNSADLAEQSASDAADSAREIEDLTVSAHTVEGDPTVTKTKQEGQPYNLDFGIPRAHITEEEKAKIAEEAASFVTKEGIGLGEVDNTSDADKPISNATQAALNDIADLIPEQASTSNQLADKDFVNSSVASNTGSYISDNGEPFTSLAALQAYSGTVKTNDYAFVTGADDQGNTYFDRYKATVTGTTVSWGKEYRLNNSSFTAAQWAAINSGITSGDVEKIALIDSLITRVGAIEVKESGWDAKYTKPDGGIPKTDLSAAVQASINLADSALQEAPVESVNNKTGAVELDADDVEAVSYGEQSLTDSQKSKARENINAAATDGYYENMSVGSASQLISPDGVNDTPENDTENNPFIIRPTAGSQSVTDGIAEIKSIRGKTQLVGGGLMNVNPSGMKTIGFNALSRITGKANLLGGYQYQITGTYTSLSYSTGQTLTPNENGYFTPTASGVLTVSGLDSETCVHFVHSGKNDGLTEDYWERTIATYISEYFPDGMNGVGNEYDEMTPAKAIKRFEKRAYRSGDENLPNVITDKIDTVVKLNTPVETPINPPLNFNYRVSDFGTEEWMYPELPFKGDLIRMDLNGDGTKETYRVLKSSGSVCEILAMENARDSSFGSSRIYAGSDLDNYLNNTWYDMLSPTTRAAIVDKTFRQDTWNPDSTGNPVYYGYHGLSNPGTIAYTASLGNASFGAEITRHVYALSVQDVLDYVLDTNVTDGQLQNYNIWEMFWNDAVSHSGSYPWLRSADVFDTSVADSNLAFVVDGRTGRVGNSRVPSSRVTRPALTIDLSMIPYEITEKTAKVRNVAVSCDIYYQSNLVDKLRNLNPLTRAQLDNLLGILD